MSLIINHNMMALNSARNLDRHYSELSTSVRRLSSGLRVGIAADDSAGLAIRELMRMDIAAVNQGIRNANDAISMIQTMDGALQIIDEKLIRMKELAEQAATGTYTSDQRIMINSEFQAMADEINRIAMATDFNGIKLLDGSLTGTHDGSGLESKGDVKIHFGSGNDSAEDYYYVSGYDARCSALFGTAPEEEETDVSLPPPPDGAYGEVGLPDWVKYPVNDLGVHYPGYTGDNAPKTPPRTLPPYALQDHVVQNQWYMTSEHVSVFLIPKGTKNIVINMNGYYERLTPFQCDNDIQLFTTSGEHIAGTPLTDRCWNSWYWENNQYKQTNISWQSPWLGFTQADYDGSRLNTGSTLYDASNPSAYDQSNPSLFQTVFNGMTIGYSGDPEQHDANPQNNSMETWFDYEILTIDEAKEDLVLYLPGYGTSFIKMQWDDNKQTQFSGSSRIGNVATQENAQQMLEEINQAIVRKDMIRADLGAMQNRLENTVSNLQIQAENLQAAESRISDIDVANEMTNFVRNQILAQAAVSMLSQANTMPHMALGVIQGN